MRSEESSACEKPGLAGLGWAGLAREEWDWRLDHQPIQHGAGTEEYLNKSF